MAVMAVMAMIAVMTVMAGRAVAVMNRSPLEHAQDRILPCRLEAVLRTRLRYRRRHSYLLPLRGPGQVNQGAGWAGAKPPTRARPTKPTRHRSRQQARQRLIPPGLTFGLWGRRRPGRRSPA